MITLLVGHRGAGKTAYLQSLKEFARRQEMGGSFYDLDQEIEKQSGRTVSDLFSAGESAFRRQEKKAFANLVANAQGDMVIALGAGFEGPVPSAARVIWIRRETDAAGRTFLGRPRLNPDLSPLAEYRHRFQVREHRFRAWAHEQLILPEGYVGGLEHFVLKPDALHVPYDFTLLPEHFRDWESFCDRRRTWGTRRFELRDDLLSKTQITCAKESLSATKLLWSVRSEKKIPASGKIDWPLELGPPPQKVHIVSRHERDGSWQNTLKSFGAESADFYKLAVEVADFTELESGHQWWLQDPTKRAFLPRSPDGRWRWYRSLFGPRMPVHYYREDDGSAADQPLLWQTQLQPAFKDYFAAVLGSPVRHSRTPLEQQSFFREKNMPVVAIDIREGEFSHALEFLIRLGLTHAAVTAPLKKAAFEVCHVLSPEAEELRAVNTLRLDGTKIEGHNTDVLALQEIARDFKGEAWLWGGEGVRSSVRKAFPGVKEFSARTGLPRPGTKDFNSPSVLIWASGRHREFILPPESVKIKQILDLNYGDDSPGLEWAVTHNLPYQSGLKMFKLQAEFQRRFWQGAK